MLLQGNVAVGADGVVYRRTKEEEMILELRMEVKDKEESMEALNARLASMEQEVYGREGDIDIPRRSLKIMSRNKKSLKSLKIKTRK
ncbi:hypothetical protein Dsin_010199 [Dipteronia sinensis]|uniref:Uncharacterized protein n=1 Tax=Dipteronia sinensis TaxID=43782 RepID=A0AAE0AT77_9ROSI|nr:hypothetical protein Dsin_010199 [Dipteronia sinensis]